MKILLIIYFLFLLNICNAQNLVPNGDFENYSLCPNDFGEFATNVIDWMTTTTNSPGISGTPDYFNECSTINVGVPNNYLGYQPAQSGTAYCGISLWYPSPSNFREYIEVQLTSNLITNSIYHFQMYVNLGNDCKYTTDDIGVYFSDVAITGINNTQPLSFVPQINNTSGNVFDTLNWTLVEGDYQASGGERYMIIGNFKNDANTSTTNLIGSYNSAYCFIDNVSLNFTTELNESQNINLFNLFPNPIKDVLNISVDNSESFEIYIYDITSRRIIQQEFTNSLKLQVGFLSKGIYIYEVRNKNSVLEKGKIIKE